MKKILVLLLLLILAPPAIIGLSYYSNIENSAVIQKYIAGALNDRFPLIVALQGKTDFKIKDGYHVYAERLELTEFSDAFESVVFEDFYASKKEYDDKEYTFTVGKVIVVKSGTAADIALADDTALIDAIYAAVSPLHTIISKGITFSVQSEKTVMVVPTRNGLQEFVLTRTNLVLKEEFHVETDIQTKNDHLSLNVRFVPDEKDGFHVHVDTNGKLTKNNNRLELSSSVVMDRDNLNYDVNLHLSTVDSKGKAIRYDVEVDRSDTTLSMRHEFSHQDLLLSGESVLQYEDNISTFIFLAGRYRQLMNNGAGNTTAVTNDFRVVKADFSIDSKTFSANLLTKDFDTKDATSLVNFIFDLSKNRRVQISLLSDVEEKHSLRLENIQYNGISVGNMELIINGVNKHEFLSLESEDFYGGNIKVVAGFDGRLSQESNYFDITGEFSHLNLRNMVTSMHGNSKYISEGTLYGFIGIETTGVELWEMKELMSGEVILETDDLKVSSKLTKLFSTTLQQTISEMDADDVDKVSANLDQNNVDIQCARSLLFIDNGLVMSNQETIFVTEHTNIYLSGGYDLKSETLDIGIVPNTKAFFDISSSPLVKYFRVTGPLDDLSMSLDAAEVLKSGASMAISYATGPLGSMAFDVLVDSAGVEIDCNRMLIR